MRGILFLTQVQVRSKRILVMLLVEVIFGRVSAVEACPRGLRSVLLSSIHKLRRYQPPFDWSKRKKGTDNHHGKGGKQVDPPWRIEGDLYPHNEECQREGDNTERKECRAVVRRRKPVIETTSFTLIRNLKP